MGIKVFYASLKRVKKSKKVVGTTFLVPKGSQKLLQTAFL